MREATIERLAREPEALDLWVLHWIINHYGLQLQEIADEAGWSPEYTRQILVGRYPMRLGKLDEVCYTLTKNKVCCQATDEYASYLKDPHD